MEKPLDGAASALRPESAPDLLGPLEGWRVWRVIRADGELRLASVVRRTVWPVREPLVAECFANRPFHHWLRGRPPHEAPQEGCRCGIYTASLETAARYLHDPLPLALARVLGRVALWGSVVEHEDGVRASHAYPAAIAIPAGAGGPGGIGAAELAAGLACYGVPVELLPPGQQVGGGLLPLP